MRLASHLGQPKQLVQQLTTSSELIDWERYLDEEFHTPTRQDFFLAQIALECRRTWVADKGKPTLEQMMLKFKDGTADQKPITDEDDETDDEIETPEDLPDRIAQSKSFWGALVAAPPPKK